MCIRDSIYLKITDRLKDIIVTAGGDTLSPVRIEEILTDMPAIAQAAVFGSERSWLCAVLVKDEEATADQVAQAITRANTRLTQNERIKRFILADTPFTIKNGLMTPTLKIKRKKVGEIYKKQISDLYAKA